MARSWTKAVAVESLDSSSVDLTTIVDTTVPFEGEDVISESVITSKDISNGITDLDGEGDQLIEDVTAVKELQDIAMESMARTGQIDRVAAMSMNAQLRIISNRYDYGYEEVAIEGFLEDTITKSNEILSKIGSIFSKLKQTVSDFMRESAESARRAFLDYRNQGIALKKVINTVLPRIEASVGETPTMPLTITGNLIFLQQGERFSPEAALALATADMEISKMSEQFRGFFAAGRQTGAIFQVDVNDPTINAIRPLSMPSSIAFSYAMPAFVRANDVTPIVGYMMPGSVFAAAAKHAGGWIETDYVVINHLLCKEKKTPSLNREQSIDYLKAAWAIANILETRMSDFIRNSDEVSNAINEVKAVREGTENDAGALIQARANVASAFATYRAVSASLANSAIGLIDYATRSMVVKSTTLVMR